MPRSCTDPARVGASRYARGRAVVERSSRARDPRRGALGIRRRDPRAPSRRRHRRHRRRHRDDPRRGQRVGKPDLAADPCVWCETNALDGATRDALRWRNPSTANHLSNVFGFAVAPLDAFGTLALASLDEHAGKKAGVDALLLYQKAFSVSAVLNQFVKLTVGRERPFVHALSPEEKAKIGAPSGQQPLVLLRTHGAHDDARGRERHDSATLRGYRLAPSSGRAAWRSACSPGICGSRRTSTG